MKWYIFLLTIGLSFACNVLNKEPNPKLCFSGNFLQKVEILSFKDTLRIKELNGKFIQLEGILHFNFEDVALYPIGSEEREEALWLHIRFPKEVSYSYLEKLYGTKMKVIGRVNLSEKGHEGAYICTLDSAFCIN